jgi:hypothetical protein
MYRSRLARSSSAVLMVIVVSGAATAQAPQMPARPDTQGAQPPVPGAARGTTPLAPLTPAAIEKAAPVVAAAQQALGGDTLAQLKALSAKGQTRRLRGNNLVPILFEMDVEFPDKYVRRDESPAENTDPTSAGFNGNELIQVPPLAPPPARAGAPPTPPGSPDAARAARVRAVKQDFVRFALGMFARSFDTYPLTFGYAGQAQAPQGSADVLDVRGPDGFAVRFFVHGETHLPIMVSWNLPPTSVIVTAPGQPPPATVAPGAVVIAGPPAPSPSASQEEKDAYAKEVTALRQKAQATPVEHRIYFADYRDVNGLKLPFRLRRAIGTDTTEETTFDRYQINPKLPPQKFAVVR